MKFLIDFWKIRAGVSVRLMRNLKVQGYSSMTQDGKHIVMLDYDELPQEWVEMECMALQDMYKLSDFYLFKTGKGFHAVCLDKLPLSELKWVYENSSADRRQWLIPILWGKKTINLRTSAKKENKVEYLKTILGSHVRERSKAHANHLEGLNVPIVSPGMLFDNNYKLLSCEYRV